MKAHYKLYVVDLLVPGKFLREAEVGLPVAELCRRHGFSEASYYLWRSKFGGMNVSDAKRLKELEAESSRLKKLLAEALLENVAGAGGGDCPLQRAGDRQYRSGQPVHGGRLYPDRAVPG
jgi:putative transposase